MLLTETEAMKRWCPFARGASRAPAGNSIASNRDHAGNVNASCLCITSNCMAWRWGPDASMKDGRLHAGHINGGEVIELGYCGAAGLPNLEYAE
jgi:hypothetical protein